MFSTVVKKKKNSLMTRRAIKSELIIPNGATEFSQEEMEYINGGVYIDYNTLTGVL